MFSDMTNATGEVLKTYAYVLTLKSQNSLKNQ